MRGCGLLRPSDGRIREPCPLKEHVVTDAQIGDILPHLLDDPGSLVPRNSREEASWIIPHLVIPTRQHPSLSTLAHAREDRYDSDILRPQVRDADRADLHLVWPREDDGGCGLGHAPHART